METSRPLKVLMNAAKAPAQVGFHNDCFLAGPTDTGTIQTTLAPGTYTVKAGSTKAVTKELAPAHLVIGKQRADSNGQVGLP